MGNQHKYKIVSLPAVLTELKKNPIPDLKLLCLKIQSLGPFHTKNILLFIILLSFFSGASGMGMLHTATCFCFLKLPRQFELGPVCVSTTEYGSRSVKYGRPLGKSPLFSHCKELSLNALEPDEDQKEPYSLLRYAPWWANPATPHTCPFSKQVINTFRV